VEFLRQLLNGIRQAWQRLSASARVNIVVAAMATLALILTMVVTASRPQYVRLYSRLDLDDSASIQTYLREQANVRFKVQDNGQTVLVPIEERSRLRGALMEQGIPRKQGIAPGFELFEEQDLMTNRWLQDIKYMRAIQGELQRQLNEFEFVNKSFVFIREAKEEVFISEQKPSEAAVTLDVTRPLSKREVKTILGIISSFGGANLNPGNITLTTTDGTALHVPPTSDFASIANSKLEYIAELEKQREERALRDLEKLGARALVKVSAVVDFDSKRETVSRAEEGAAISESANTVSITSQEALPEGAPGVMAHMPVEMGAPGGTATTEETEETITNYQPTITETETVTEPGEVKQYIVSAIIEGKTETSTDEAGNEIQTYVGLTPEQVTVYENHLRAAVGEGRIPTEITVNDHPFEIDKLAAARIAIEEIEYAEFGQMMLQYIMNGVKVLLIVIGFFLVRRFMQRATMVEVEEEEIAAEMPHATPEDLRRRDVAVEVERLSAEEPETVAALLRSWITEKEE